MYTTTNELQDVTLSWKCDTPKKIELGWVNPFSFQKLCSTLTSSYHDCAERCSIAQYEGDLVKFVDIKLAKNNISEYGRDVVKFVTSKIIKNKKI